MESELIAIGLVLLVVGAVLLAAIGATPTPLDLHIAAVRAGSEAQGLVNQLTALLPW
ncbi:MAG: hypothetical protein ABI888_00740 [Chloroflexota bacterium]